MKDAMSTVLKINIFNMQHGMMPVQGGYKRRDV